MLGLRPEDVVKRPDRMLIGWANYFSLGPIRHHPAGPGI